MSKNIKSNSTSARLNKDALTATAEADSRTISINKIRLQLTHLNKLFWPDEGYTKGDLIEYYNAVYKYMIPYLRNRPQSMKRSPNGITESSFFQKDVATSAPDWATTISIYSESNNKEIEYLICNDKATLLYMANLGCIEINPWNSVSGNLDKPSYLVLDLDPSDANTFGDVIAVANTVKAILNKAGATCYPKTSGASGMHIYVPLGQQYTHNESRLFAELAAQVTVTKMPGIATVERAIDKRDNKLYIDFMQNKTGQTLAAPYSVRPKPGATVSMPLDWKEVKKSLCPSQFTIRNAVKRIEQKGDLFKGVLGRGIDLKSCLKKIEKL